MMPTNFSVWPNSPLELLLDAALRSLILASAAGLALAVFRVKSTSLRLFTWTGVLYAALGMPLIAALLPALPVPVPSILRTENTASASPRRWISQVPHASPKLRTVPIAPSRNPQEEKTLAAGTSEFPSAIMGSSTHVSTSDVLQWLSDHWAMLAGGIYCSIALLMMARLWLGTLLARRLVSGSRRIRDPRLANSLGSQMPGWSHITRILESDRLTVPVTIGSVSPAIVLPADWRAWDDTKLDAVIAHELSHVVRRDALTQFLSSLYRAAFWFSPLSWWLDRQIHLLAEEASDEAALSAGVDRSEYAKTLLGFFENIQASPGRVWWQGVAMANAGQAEHRLERILSWRGAVNMGAKRSVLVTIVALAVPAVYLVAAARPANHNVVVAQSSSGAQIPAPPSEPGAVPPAPAVAPVLPSAPVRGPVAYGVPAPALPAVPASPGVPAAPAIAPSWQDHGAGSSRNGTFYGYSFDDSESFVIVSGNSDSLTMSGTSEDAHHVQRLKKKISGDFIWFRRDEKSYIIRDQATIDHARKLWSPQEELGKKQEELGKQQEALGKQQEELEAKMEQVRVNIPDMTAQMDALKAKLQKLGPTATMDQLGELQSEIGELQSKIGEIQSHAGEAQGKLGSEQGALGEKQGKLGELQGELGRQQAELAQRATKQMKALLDEAIKNGTAKPEPESDDGGTI